MTTPMRVLSPLLPIATSGICCSLVATYPALLDYGIAIRMLKTRYPLTRESAVDSVMLIGKGYILSDE